MARTHTIRADDQRDDAPEDDARVKINSKGTGISLNWTALGVLAAALIGGALWCNNVTNTAGDHTRVLAEHGTALVELKTDIKNVKVEIDALLIERGINPHQVIQDAARK